MRPVAALVIALAAPAALPAAAAQDAVPSPDEIDAASFTGADLSDGRSALTVVVQTLLDRAGISPGVIDGYKGGMSESAIRAFEAREGLPVDGMLDAVVWLALGGPTAAPITAAHAITADEASVVGALPEDYAALAERERLGYQRVSEAVAEHFHMDEDFLIALNPEAAFREGEEVVVVQPGPPRTGTVARIEVDAVDQRLRAFDASGAVITNYPVAVGSDATPSPSGTHEVEAIAFDANYTYDPDVNFQQGDNDEMLILPPGPNNPIGTLWIDLSEPTYGIHGTPEPARLFVDQSHGCVRMTNWDAEELAAMVDERLDAGEEVVVEFVR